jgi:hypothetical protein
MGFVHLRSQKWSSRTFASASQKDSRSGLKRRTPLLYQARLLLAAPWNGQLPSGRSRGGKNSWPRCSSLTTVATGMPPSTSESDCAPRASPRCSSSSTPTKVSPPGATGSANFTLTSRWCVVEVSLARSLGKPVFPRRLNDDARLELLDDAQWVDLAVGER